MKWLQRLPISLLAFPLAAALFTLQTIPAIGVFLMLFGAAVWTGTLVNAGMLGLLVEVPIRHFGLKGTRLSAKWLMIPIAYFGIYSIFAYSDHRTLQNLRAEYDANNAQVDISFDPQIQSLVLADSGHNFGAELTQNYGLPVAYTENKNYPEGYLATSLLSKNFCEKIRDEPLMGAASIHIRWIVDEDRIRYQSPQLRFCALSRPAKPDKDTVRVATIRTERLIERLPVRLVKNTVTMPDGSEFVLRGGVAAPYPWFPAPILGCVLNSAGPSWRCVYGFARDGFTPIVSSSTQYGGDVRVLARALGLQYIHPKERKTFGSEQLEEELRDLMVRQLARDIADVREAAADPSIRLSIHSTQALMQTPEALASLAPTIVEGIKRAAVVPDNIYLHRETGRTLATLFGRLPRDIQNSYAFELFPLYEKADEANDGRHWLYKAGDLLRFRSRKTYDDPEPVAEQVEPVIIRPPKR